MSTETKDLEDRLEGLNYMRDEMNRLIEQLEGQLEKAEKNSGNADHQPKVANRRLILPNEYFNKNVQKINLIFENKKEKL